VRSPDSTKQLVRVGACPVVEARRAAITFVTLTVRRRPWGEARHIRSCVRPTEICDAARAFIAERDWEKFQDPKSVLLALVGEVGELAELVQWLPAGEARGAVGEAVAPTDR
jgi:hypothetical protein